MNQRVIKQYLGILVLCSLFLCVWMTKSASAYDDGKHNEAGNVVAAADDSVAETAEASNIASGTGWYLDSTGCLHITGNINNETTWNGYNYFVDSILPWDEYISKIITVVAHKGAKVNSGVGLFQNCPNLVSADLQYLDTTKVTDMAMMFMFCPMLTTVNASGWNTSNVTNMSHMFYECSKLTAVDTTGWNTSKVTKMQNMFMNCSLLTTLNPSGWNTTNVTDMSWMFCGCNSLKSMNLGGWNTANVTDMSCMFANCYNLQTLSISNWKTGNVTNMESMFYNSAITSLNLSAWDTSGVDDMSEMFAACNNLVSLNLSGWNIENVTCMIEMFASCSKLESLNVSEWNTENLECADGILDECNSLCQVSYSKGMTSVMSDILLKLRPQWENPKTGKIYQDKESLQLISGQVTLISHEIEIERCRVGWDGITIKWIPVTGQAVTIYRRDVGLIQDDIEWTNELIPVRFSENWTKVATTTAGGYYDKTVKNGKGYEYRLVVNKSKTGHNADSEIVRYVQPPKIQSVTNVSGGVKVSWSSVDGANGYYVYRKDTQAGKWHLIGSSGKTLTYTDKTAQNGVVYYYAVKAYYSEGGTYKSFSASSSAKNTVYVKNVFISSITNPRLGEFTVVHSVNDKATGYQIAYSTNSNMSGSKYVTQAGGNYTTIKAKGLTKGKTYYVMVRPYKVVAGYTFYGAWSAKKTITVTK